MVELTREESVFVLRFDHGENRFDGEFVDACNAALDEVEKAEAPVALVTVGTGKFYSNGLDLEYMGGLPRSEVGAYLRSVLSLQARILTCPMTTVAAVNGHAFGAGAQIAVAHDFQIMREDRGYFCMPEVDMGAPLHPAMTALLRARLPVRTVHQVIATGNRFGGVEAAALGIVDRAVAEEEVLPQALAAAAALAGKANPAMATLKRDLHAEVIAAIDQPVPSMG
jgi:enoyl-CoA hydratase/carnithine racemase